MIRRFLCEKKHVNKIRKMKRVKFIIILLGVLYNYDCFSQKTNIIIINGFVREEYKKANLTGADFIFIDAATKDTIKSNQILYYINDIAFQSLQTATILFKKGTYKIRIRCLGYKDSELLKLKVRIKKTYQITFYLIQTDERLH